MIQILITSSVLIAVIALARLLLRRRVSQRLIYALWLLVAVRLLVPIQFGQSRYSVSNMVQPAAQQVQQAVSQPISGPSREELYQQLLSDYLNQQQSITPSPEAPSPNRPATLTPSLEVEAQLRQDVQAQTIAPSIVQILTTIWIVGMVLMALWFMIANLLFLHRTRQGRRLVQKRGRVPIYISDQVSSPCLAGLIRPKIYLTPTSTQNQSTLRHVLTHELCHLRHGDHIWSFVRCVCLCIYWFNPLVWAAALVSKRDQELACDEAALKILGEQERIGYGRTLLATITHAHSASNLIHTATAMNESKKNLIERVNLIVKKPRNTLLAAISLILVAALAVGCSFAGPQTGETQSTTSPTTPSATDPTITSEESPTEPSQTPTTHPSETVPDNTEPPTTAPSVSPPTYNELYQEIIREYRISRLYGLPQEENPIVENLIDKYNLYWHIGVFCEYEYEYADMSQYLTDQQKQIYHYFQYRITCCQTAEQVHAHTARFLDPSLMDVSPDKKLFRDDNGTLYLMVTPTGSAGYNSFYELNASETQIVVFAEYGYDDYEESAIILLESQDGTWLIRSILPIDGSNNTESYRYLLEEIPGTADVQAYGQLLADAFFLNPHAFLEQLSALDANAIADLMYHTAVEKPLYIRLLDALSARTDLTAGQQSALQTLRNACS